MNLVRIVFKEFKQNIRDWRGNAMMIALPIVLMAVLGAALSGIFSSAISLDMDVLYSIQDEGALAQAFATFKDGVGSTGVRFTRAVDTEESFSSVKDFTYACYLVVSERGITFYENDRYSSVSDFVQSLIRVFLRQYNAARAIAAVNPMALLTLKDVWGQSHVENTSLQAAMAPRSIDYYAVTMLTLAIMIASILGMQGMKKEMKLKTARRMLTAPVRRWQILAGKVSGGLLVIFIQIAAVIAFSRFAIGAYWGTDIATVMLVLLSEAVMAVSLGVGVAYLISNEGAAVGILNSIFPVLVLFGGGYGPFEGGAVFTAIARVDPLTWVHRAIFGVIYNADYSSVPAAVLTCLGVSLLFILAAALLSRKETA
jgi:ABC-2 type transport system permease protein